VPYKSPGARRTANREAQRRRRARLAAEAAAVAAEAAAVPSPGAVPDARRAPSGASVSLGPGDGGRIGSGPPHNDLTDVPGDDGEFVTLRHRCTTCGVVREVAIPPIEALGGFEVRELRGRCAQCERTPEAAPGGEVLLADGGPVLGPVDCGAVLRAPVGRDEPYVAPPRPSRADVLRERPAGSRVLVADESGLMRPAAEVLAEDSIRAAMVAGDVDPRNFAYEPNRHGAPPITPSLACRSRVAGAWAPAFVERRLR
jgi:hypothetical protein